MRWGVKSELWKVAMDAFFLALPDLLPDLPAAACTPISCSVIATWAGCLSGCVNAPPLDSSHSVLALLLYVASMWQKSRRMSSAAQVSNVTKRGQ